MSLSLVTGTTPVSAWPSRSPWARAGHDVYVTMRNAAAAPEPRLDKRQRRRANYNISAILAANRGPTTALENVVISTGHKPSRLTEINFLYVRIPVEELKGGREETCVINFC